MQWKSTKRWRALIHRMITKQQLKNEQIKRKHACSFVRPKIGNREKHQGKDRKCPKKQGKHYVKHGEALEEIVGNMQGIAVYKDFMGIQSPVFKPCHIQTEQGISIVFRTISILCKMIRNFNTQQVDRGTGCSVWMQLNLFCDIPDILRYEFIMQQCFNELIGGKLGLSQKFKTKQVLILFDCMKGTSIEEEKRKVILHLLSVIYDFEEKNNTFKLYFSCFDYFLFIFFPRGQRLYYLGKQRGIYYEVNLL